MNCSCPSPRPAHFNMASSFKNSSSVDIEYQFLETVWTFRWTPTQHSGPCCLWEVFYNIIERPTMPCSMCMCPPVWMSTLCRHSTTERRTKFKSSNVVKGFNRASVTYDAIFISKNQLLTLVLHFWVKSPPAQFLNRKIFLFSVGLGRLMTFPGYGLGTKCNNHISNRAPEVVRHDIKHTIF